MPRRMSQHHIATNALLSLALLSALGCRPRKQTSGPTTTSKVDRKPKPERPVIKFEPDHLFKSPESIESWRRFRTSTDALATAGKDRLLLYAKCGDEEGQEPSRLVKVPDKDHWPEDSLEDYVLLLDESRRIVLFQIVPMSASGDWAESEDFYSDPSGVVRYWEHFRATVDSPDEPQKAWQAVSRRPDGSTLERISLAVDGDGKVWAGQKPPEPPVRPQRIKDVLEQVGLLDALRTAGVSQP